ncbi:37S ribosomal protein S5, mitochondrial [[Candida] anglica]|uniref:37S ribosomal protein S5, mitochondrial n=1 Tax=[Candida] anglica TaxID=148631 RepID=A0ABP0E7Y1_9ASCO
MFKNTVCLAGRPLHRITAGTTRLFSSSIPTLKDERTVESHLQFLSKFYTPDLLQSIKITESLVTPKQVLDLKKRGLEGKSKAAPSDVSSDLHRADPKWTEPIVYPNQADNRSPYAPIPANQAPDRTDLVMRFKETKTKAKNDRRADRKAFTKGLSNLTGLDEGYVSRLYVRPIVMKRVSCQTSKGKIPNFYALTVVGDKNGMIGLGEGKSRDGMRTALGKAHWNAVKNLTPITRYEDRTIIGNIDHRYHAVKLFLKSAPSGFGLRVNSNIFEVCQAAGIKDLAGKVYKSRNPMNVTKGFVEALTKQRSLEDLASGRGKKLVDLRKVYYSA